MGAKVGWGWTGGAGYPPDLCISRCTFSSRVWMQIYTLHNGLWLIVMLILFHCSLLVELYILSPWGILNGDAYASRLRMIHWGIICIPELMFSISFAIRVKMATSQKGIEQARRNGVIRIFVQSKRRSTQVIDTLSQQGIRLRPRRQQPMVEVAIVVPQESQGCNGVEPLDRHEAGSRRQHVF